MRVILLKEIEKLGSPGDVVEVKDGYGRNYLIPMGYALEARKGYLKDLEHKKRIVEAKLRKERRKAETIAEKLERMVLTIKKKVGEEGKLFGSVTAMDIEKALEGEGIEVDRRNILIEEPIKHVGDYTVKVRVHPERTVDLKLVVEGEE